jgi:histidinol-phosphate aminotransferase
MRQSRRGFVESITGRGTLTRAGVAEWLAARGNEDYQARAGQAAVSVPPGVKAIKISGNENPLGPGKAAIDAVVRSFPEASRYPFNGTPADHALAAALARSFSAKPENVVLGAGSQEILKSAVRCFTAPGRGVVTASPSFENPVTMAKKLGHPVVEVKLDAALRLDLDAMAAAVKGAGLVFVNNPNNPTATVHGGAAIAAFVKRVRAESPDTVILIDEAYHDYVTDPAYRTAVPLALETPNVIVARTFSKAYGMAGLRIGYALGAPATIAPLNRLRMPYNVATLSVAAAMASLADPKHIAAERERNVAVRAFTVKVFDELGCRASDSQTNFIFVDIGRTAASFRDACALQGILVGRDFPPLEQTHARISIGTMDEMKKAASVFRSILRPVTTTAGR